MKKWKDADDFLVYLNNEYTKRHKAFETLFWRFAMGEHAVDTQKQQASQHMDEFRSDSNLLTFVREYKKTASGETKERLVYWERFFSLHQVPPPAAKLKQQITALEQKIQKHRATRKEGYRDPHQKKFVEASSNALASIMVSNPDEAIRKACFEARESLAVQNVTDYIRLVSLRNKYARLLGYTDFYAYKLHVEEGMTKKELFSLFDDIYKKTKYAFKTFRELEKTTMPGLRKPWNFSFMFAGEFTKEQDPYFPFEEALSRWAISFTNLGIDFQGGALTLDLLDRKGKYNNGFCHWPVNVYYDKNGTRVPGESDFTCNVVLGTPGSAYQGYVTLFHEGGHAAHLLNADMKDVSVTTEYPPLSTAWAETQSMFLDTVLSSVEWMSRYAKTREGKVYPFEFFERKVKKLGPLRPHGTVSAVSMVAEFEKRIYEAKVLTKEKVLALATSVYKKYNDFSVDSYRILNIPHLYSWESACSYHGYGLATLALNQWREYFFKKYGYIVDNPMVGKEMKEVWHFGGAKTFPEFVRLATKKDLSADAYIKAATMSDAQVIKKAKKQIEFLKTVPQQKKVNLNARIKMVHGKKVVADSKEGFSPMVKKYGEWIATQYPKEAVAQKRSAK